MKKLSILASLLILTMAVLGSGCDLFGGDSSPAATGTSINASKLAKIQVPVNLNTDTAVNAAPARAADATALAAAVDFEFLDAATLLTIKLASNPVVKTVGATTVVEAVGEFIGVKVLVRIKSKTTTTKVSNVYLGQLPATTTASTTTVITSTVTVTPATILATEALVSKQAGADEDAKIKALAAAATYLLVGNETPQVNEVYQVAEDIAVVVGNDTAVITQLTTVNAGGTAADTALTTINTNVTARVAPVVTGISPTTIAKKDVEAAAGQITVTGTGFGTDTSKITVTVLQGTTVVATKTAANITLTDTSIKFNILAAEIKTATADYTGKTLTIKVKKVITATTDEPEVTPATTLTVTPAALQSIAVTPATASIVKGTTQQFAATATYDDTTTATVTSTVTWTATSGTISAAGLYTAPDAEATVTVTAALGGKTGTATVNVVTSPLASIAVTGTGAATSVKQGYTLQMVATGTLENAQTTDLSSSATWSVVSGSGTISATGLLTATGTTQIVVQALKADAKNGNVTGQLTVTIDPLTAIAVTATKTTLAANETSTLTATGTYTAAGSVDISTLATFTVTAGTGAGTVSGVTFTPTTPGTVVVSAAFSGVNSATGLTLTITDDPVISNVTITRTGDTTATVTWTTVYDITVGKVTYSKPDSVTNGPGFDPFSLKVITETGAATKTHSVTLPDVDKAFDWRVQVTHDKLDANTSLSTKYDSAILTLAKP